MAFDRQWVMGKEVGVPPIFALVVYAMNKENSKIQRLLATTACDIVFKRVLFKPCEIINISSSTSIVNLTYFSKNIFLANI